MPDREVKFRPGAKLQLKQCVVQGSILNHLLLACQSCVICLENQKLKNYLFYDLNVKFCLHAKLREVTVLHAQSQY